jgi:MoCo/4Fe-4S cofactor protein with predicted Tat translocation signal
MSHHAKMHDPKAGEKHPNPPGRTYWRSLDELADRPEFRQWVEREFPEGASELNDPLTRRHFLKIMSASFLLAGVGISGTGCRRPVEKIVPFGKMPENYVHGVPQYYATAMPCQGSAVPIVVKSHDGRPTKIEGNSLHPDSNGGTDRYAQASILNLYDPDRCGRHTSNGKNTTAESAMDFLSQLARTAEESKGKGLYFLLDRNNSPSRRRLQEVIRKKLPEARWHVYEPIDLDIHRRAASLAFGQSVKPHYDFEKADVIVSLDCDFLGSEEDVHGHIRRFARRRHMRSPEDTLNRLYVIESLMTVTGFSADHRLRVPGSLVGQIAATLAAGVGAPPGADTLAGTAPEGEPGKWGRECAADLLAHKGRSLVVAGHRQPVSVHLLAHAVNAALGNVGKTVFFHPVPEAIEAGIVELAQALNAGLVDTLVILGGNPVYAAPADLDWATTQRKAKRVVRLGYYEDETFPVSDWHLPAAHYLESWGDAQTADGTLVPVQPLIAPLFGGLTELEVLARLAGEKTTSPYSIVRETFAKWGNGTDTDAAWRKFLHDGFLAESAAKPVEVKLNAAALTEAWRDAKATPPGKDNLEIVFHRDYSLDDGRYGNNGWLQELPDPITKMVWDNAVLVSRKTAAELKVQNEDLVEIALGQRKITGPIWIQPGLADYTLGLALGYGRAKAGRVGQGAGFNAYPLRTAAAQNIAAGATLRPLGKSYPLSCTQSHWSLEGRPVIREVNLEQYRQQPDFAKRMGEEALPVVASLYPNPLDQLKSKALHQWGMAIDLNMCVGCSACVLACQSENNVPIVGKEQVKRGREMHWLRIDRYYSGRPLNSKDEAMATFNSEAAQQFAHWIENPQAVTQPMLCQHCEAAPCENVCPVNATSHDQEGLNVMTYNRCVGTRYCSNNCPYKVRRFNFFDYNKRPITGNSLYLGPLAKRPDDEWDLIRMVKNPDVTVRMRGVMEKCTFCLQRIEQAKIGQKVKAGASGDVVVPEGTFTTACAQACPAGAIVFGNLNDPQSRVSQLKKLDRDYSVLEPLFTRPRLTYLARIRNPNPKMPDYHDAPLSYEEYRQKTSGSSQHGQSGHAESGPAAGHEPAGKGAH